MSWSHLSISGVFQLLLTRFRPNFKGRFLGPSLTDANCLGDICPGNKCPGNICPGNICPGNICPYQQYLSCYSSDFDHQLFFRPKIFVGSTIFLPAISLDTKKFLNPKLFWTQIFLRPQNFFQTQIFFSIILFRPKIFLDPNFFLEQKYNCS